MAKKQRKARKKKEKLPFWKKLGPEFKNIGDHIGKIIDNSSLKDVSDVAIMGALAYVGYQHFKSPQGALIGPLGYKLATTMGGQPPASQIAGLAILGAMGLAAYDPMSQVQETIKQLTGVDETVRIYMAEHYGLTPDNYFIYDTVTFMEACPEYPGPGKKITVFYSGGLAKACVYAPTIGNGGAG